MNRGLVIHAALTLAGVAALAFGQPMPPASSPLALATHVELRTLCAQGGYTVDVVLEDAPDENRAILFDRAGRGFMSHVVCNSPRICEFNVVSL